jgi:hypothetical protein
MVAFGHRARRQGKEMPSSGFHITLSEPAICIIRVRGALSPDWSDRLGGLRISPIGRGDRTITELVGRIQDQAALHGVLTALYELGLPLLTVDCTPAVDSARSEGQQRRVAWEP